MNGDRKQTAEAERPTRERLGVLLEWYAKMDRDDERRADELIAEVRALREERDQAEQLAAQYAQERDAEEVRADRAEAERDEARRNERIAIEQRNTLSAAIDAGVGSETPASVLATQIVNLKASVAYYTEERDEAHSQIAALRAAWEYDMEAIGWERFPRMTQDAFAALADVAREHDTQRIQRERSLVREAYAMGAPLGARRITDDECDAIRKLVTP